MATDYDAPRVSAEDEPDDAGLHVLRTAASATSRRGHTEDEATLGEDLELPGADMSGESLTVTVVPQAADEFTCPRCFLVKHTSQRTAGGHCSDCD